MFKKHVNFKRVAFWAFIAASSISGVGFASTPGEGPGNIGNTDIPPLPGSDWVMEYYGCGLCGLQNGTPDYQPYVPGVGSGNGSGGFVEVPLRGTYPTSDSVTATTRTHTTSRGYANGARVDFIEVTDIASGSILSITATISVLANGGTKILGSAVIGPPGLPQANVPFEIYFQNGYMIYTPPNQLDAVELFRPV